MSARTVATYMTQSPLTIDSHQTISAAQRLMNQHAIRHLPVVQDGRLVGVISDRDLQFVETLKTLDPETAFVEDAMSHDPLRFAPTSPLAEVAGAMAESKFGSAVIVDEGERVVGVFTTIDALRALAAIA
jgi:acetoin utilization protein AcuB